MAHPTIYKQSIEMLLGSITKKMGEDGQLCSFFFGKPGTPEWQHRLGTEFYCHDREMTLTVLYVRKHGPIHLRYLPMGDIWSLLQQFLRENYWLLADEAMFNHFEGTYAEHISDHTKSALADTLASSKIFEPTAELNVFPLVTVTVNADFDAPNFFLVAPTSLNKERLPERIEERHINSRQFPPLTEWTGKKEIPSAWLGIRSPAPKAAEKQKSVILGAIALTPLPRYRHMFSGRSVFGGQCTISDRTTTSFGPPHTPPIMHNVIIDQQDHEWLDILAKKLLSNEKAVRRQLRALEYFYRAWSLDPSERFPVLCMALDAIFGEVGSAAQAVIDGVRSVVGSHVEDARLRKIMDLRAAVIHGGAPDVYDSSKYDEYYAQYGVDPIRDMELVVSRCLRRKIFNDVLTEHADPLADTIKQAQAQGHFPKKIERPTFLDGPTKIAPE